MAHMYIALVDTPGFFAALIRRFLRQRYIHVVIAHFLRRITASANWNAQRRRKKGS